MGMGIVKLHQVFLTYQNLLKDRGARPIRMEGPEPEEHHLYSAQIDHLFWMCEQGDIFLGEAITRGEAGDKPGSQSKIEKAFRWLGFVQGSFWLLKIRSVDQMKRDNMADEETFDRSKI